MAKPKKILGVPVSDDFYAKYKHVITSRANIIRQFNQEKEKCKRFKLWHTKHFCYQKCKMKFKKQMLKNLNDELHLLKQLTLFAADVGMALLVKRRMIRIGKRIANLTDYI